MKAFTVLFPVFLMLFLGYFSRKKRLLTYEQNEGAKSVVLKVLFSFLVYNVLVSSRISKDFFNSYFICRRMLDNHLFGSQSPNQFYWQKVCASLFIFANDSRRW